MLTDNQDAWDTYMQNPALDFSGQWWPGLDAQQQLQQQQGQTGVSPAPVPAQITPGGPADRVRPLPRHPNLFFLDSNNYGNGQPMSGSYSNGSPQQPNQGAPGQSAP